MPFTPGPRTANVLGGGWTVERLHIIEGLSEEQCRLLQGTQVGDLLWIQKSPIPGVNRTYEQRPSWADGAADWPHDGGWGGIQEGGVEYDGGEGRRLEVDQLDSVNEASAVAKWGYEGLDELARSLIPDLAPTVEGSKEESATETALNEDATTKTPDGIYQTGTPRSEADQEDEHHSADHGHGPDPPALIPLALTAELEEYRFNRYGFDREGYDADGYDKEGYNRNGHDRSGYDRDGIDSDGYDYDGYDSDNRDRYGNNRYTSYNGKSSYDPQHHSKSDLYIVVGELKRDDGTIVDIFLQNLEYQDSRGWEMSNTYRLYCDKIEVQTNNAASSRIADSLSLANIVRTDSPVEGRIMLNPDGDVLRSALLQAGSFHHSCNAGFLYSLSELQDIYPDTPYDLNDFRPLCPVCVGTELVDEQLELRRLRRLRRNAALNQLGFVDPEYDSHGFNEREWGFDWEGMRGGVEEGQSGEEHGDDIPWHLLPPEARDPNHDILARPASADAISALPRRLFREIVYQEDEPYCRICSQELMEDTTMIELPCGHFFCECLTQWLEHQHSYPSCRVVISHAETDGGVIGGGVDSARAEVDEGAAGEEIHAGEQLDREEEGHEGNGLDEWVQVGGSGQSQYDELSTAHTVNTVGWTSGEGNTLLRQSENAPQEAVPESDW